MARDFLKRVDLCLEECLQEGELNLNSSFCSSGSLSRGKKLRAKLFLGFSDNCDGQAVLAASAVELFHYATLVHDDIIDDAGLRRGLLTPAEGSGVTVRVLLGDILFSRGFKLLARLEDDRIWKEVNGSLSDVIAGELMQQRRKWDLSLSEEEYMRIVRLKTGSLFAVSCKIGEMMSSRGGVDACGAGMFGNAMGASYQILDDCLDVSGRSCGKKGFKDIENGIVTLPVLELARNGGEEAREALQAVFDKGDPGRLKGIPRIADRIDASGTLKRCLGKAEALLDEAESALRSVPGRAQEVLNYIKDRINECKV